MRRRNGINGAKIYSTGDDFIVITGNTRCTNGDCPYIKEVGDCTGDIENCEYRQQRNDAFVNYTFDGL